MRLAIKTTIAVLFCLAFAAGCGQNGPLFLPGDASSIQTDVPAQNQPEQTDEESENEDDDRE